MGRELDSHPPPPPPKLVLCRLLLYKPLMGSSGNLDSKWALGSSFKVYPVETLDAGFGLSFWGDQTCSGGTQGQWFCLDSAW